jgi:aminopeptidase N
MTNSERLLNQFKPESYKISLDLTEADYKKFSGIVEISGKHISGNKLKLHSKSLDIHEVRIGRKLVDYKQIDDDVIAINHTGSNELISINIKYGSEITEPMHGLYPSSFYVGKVKHAIYSTQLESHYAREVFPCIDEPSAKATFELQLKTKSDLTTLSNTTIDSQASEPNLTITRFKITPIMSTYLFAFVVGEVHSVSAKSKSGIEVAVYSSIANNKRDLKFALEASIKILDFYEEYFGIKYPLSKIDNVAIPDFSAGAMENWGLITYREEALIVTKDSTIDDRKNVAKVIAHELAHQWFGNLVTMKWWNDLWLNESFATLIEYVAVDKIFPDWEIWNDFSSSEVIYSLQRDCYDKVQPVRVDVNDPGEIGALFDGAIVYAKGARLIKMLISYVGEDIFRLSLKNYFNKFKFKNTEADDLWDSISEISGKDIKSLMHPWLEQSGYPIVSIKKTSISQNRFYIGKAGIKSTVWPIVLDSDNAKIPKLMRDRKINLDKDIGKYNLNVNDSSHFITLYDDVAFRTKLSSLAGSDTSIVNKLQFVHEQLLLSKGGYQEYTQLIEILVSIKNESSYLLWSNASIIISDIYKIIGFDELAIKSMDNFVKQIVQIQTNRLGLTKKIDESESDTQLRQIIVSLLVKINDPQFYEFAKNIYANTAIENIDPEIRGPVLVAITKNSKTDNSSVKLLSTYLSTNSPSLKSDIVSALTATKSSNFTKEMFNKLLDHEIVKPQDLLHWLVSYLSRNNTRTQAWSWIRTNWIWIEKTYDGDNNLDYFPKILARNLIDISQMNEYIKFFKPLRKNQILTRAIDVGIIEIKSRIKIADKERSRIIKYLNNL